MDNTGALRVEADKDSSLPIPREPVIAPACQVAPREKEEGDEKDVDEDEDDDGIELVGGRGHDGQPLVGKTIHVASRCCPFFPQCLLLVFGIPKIRSVSRWAYVACLVVSKILQSISQSIYQSIHRSRDRCITLMLNNK